MTNELEDEDLDTGMEFTMQEIYDKLIMEDDLIITVDSEVVESIKASIKSIKGKLNAKLKADDMPPDDSRIKFTELSCPECAVGVTKLQISLVKKKTYTIHSIEKAGDF